MNKPDLVNKSIPWRIVLTVTVSSLGFFVDTYDLFVFSVYRVASLTDLDIPVSSQLNVGANLMNVQMIGLILGGVLWGVLGDKRGRTSVLFGSIFVYSVANLANAFVHDVNAYALLRLIAGIGLAGEVGAALTLISEAMSRESRTYGTAILFSMGFFGAVAAAIAGKYLTWRVGYFCGGALGMALLAMRAGLFESGMYAAAKKTECERGSLKMLFQHGRWKKLVLGTLCGLPGWFTAAILATFLPEFARQLSVSGPVSAADGVLYLHAGLFVGSFCASLTSQWLKSRKRAMIAFFLVNVTANLVFLSCHGLTPIQVYALFVLGGFGVGFVAVSMTIAAELFGTNLRATAATSITNLVRACSIPMVLALQVLTPQMGVVHAAWVIRIVTLVVGVAAMLMIEETFGKDLDYIEI